jgi:NIPSNAP
MIHRTVGLIAFTLAVFLAGYWSGTANSPVKAQTENRVFELRTYHTYEGKLDALLTRFRDHTVDIFNRHGMTSIGYWLPTDERICQNSVL